MMVKRSRSWSVGALVLALLVIAALVAPLAQAAPASQAATVLRVGYLGPADTPTANGAQLTIDQINGAGGFTGADGVQYQFELLTLAAPPTNDTFQQDIKAFTAQDAVALIGPDTNALLSEENIALLANTDLPILTGATFNALTDNDEDNIFFRIRAPEDAYSAALADYLVGDLAVSSVALVLTDVVATEALLSFDTALQARNINAEPQILLESGSELDANLDALLDANPEAVVMWGLAQDAGLLLSELREAGWTGQFAYRFAAEGAGAGLLPADWLADVIGVNAWSFADPSEASQVFLQDYITTFGAVPGALSAAAYDALWLLRAAVIAGGPEPDPLRAALLALGPQTIVQGPLNPAAFGNGDLTRAATVYELTAGGGARVLAQYSAGERLR